MGTVFGEPASKANSRKKVIINGKTRFIRSAKALGLSADWDIQWPKMSHRNTALMEGDIRASFWLYYASRRPDLDESIILDLLEGRAYRNDRQVRERHTYWRLDKNQPRSVFLLAPMESDPCESPDGCCVQAALL